MMFSQHTGEDDRAVANWGGRRGGDLKVGAVFVWAEPVDGNGCVGGEQRLRLGRAIYPQEATMIFSQHNGEDDRAVADRGGRRGSDPTVGAVFVWTDPVEGRGSCASASPTYERGKEMGLRKNAERTAEGVSGGGPEPNESALICLSLKQSPAGVRSKGDAECAVRVSKSCAPIYEKREEMDFRKTADRSAEGVSGGGPESNESDPLRFGLRPSLAGKRSTGEAERAVRVLRPPTQAADSDLRREKK